jgi:hypothetical protein
VAITLNLFDDGTVGFIEWLGSGAFCPIPTEKQLGNATKAQGTNDCSTADPFPSGRSEWQKPETIAE